MNSVRLKCWFGSAGIMLLMLGSAAAEERKTFSADVSMEYFNKYVWRGQNVNDSSVFQPNVSGSAYGFTGSIWGNIDLTNGLPTVPGNAGEFSEINYGLDYSSTIPGAGRLQFSLGVIHYLFPNTSFESTTELYGGLAADVFLSPSLAWNRDVGTVNGSYIRFSLSHSFDKVMSWTEDNTVGIDIESSVAWAGAGYNRGYFDIDAAKFNDLALRVGVPIDLKSISVTPSLHFSSMLSRQVGIASFERNNVWFGIEVMKKF
jgi:hypothetical protein